MCAQLIIGKLSPQQVNLSMYTAGITVGKASGREGIAMIIVQSDFLIT
ncbi:hypothetical protein [Nostoc sp.]